ncbi:HlyD family efflux transporter periplasmic adaptor subunit [Paraburkholderia sediminicola]|uniref:HlyD family efflux transporter periplasmic adaptor subunit n=1 Tax=Paraburkholderia sediminicola TaxID=458836 RepID=UPI0038B7DA07
MSLTAPVAATIQQLVIHTVGGVATTPQSLMEIVPDDVAEVEANIENKDIGLRRPGKSRPSRLKRFPVRATAN